MIDNNNNSEVSPPFVAHWAYDGDHITPAHGQIIIMIEIIIITRQELHARRHSVLLLIIFFCRLHFQKVLSLVPLSLFQICAPLLRSGDGSGPMRSYGAAILCSSSLFPSNRQDGMLWLISNPSKSGEISPKFTFILRLKCSWESCW